MTRWIVGLGNPGSRYSRTRHNAGFWFVERWAESKGLSFRRPWFRPFLLARLEAGDDTLLLVKPLTFMNRSGQALARLLRRGQLAPSDVLVVFDQMDLPPGRARLRLKGSSAGHNGLKSLDEAFGGRDYARLAVGIGRPERGVVEHVLGEPSPSDAAAILATIDRLLPVCDAQWRSGWEVLVHGVNALGNPPAGPSAPTTRDAEPRS